MKLSRLAFLVAVSLTLLLNASAQSFQDLDFEQAVITPDPSSPYYPYGVFASDAIPGWTAVGFISPTDILYNDFSTGATSVSLFSPGMDGSFSISLYGGVEGPAGGASISQTGLVPAGSASIRFIAKGSPIFAGPLLVSLSGQNIPITAISTGPNFTTYAGDVSAFAGQAELLAFTTPQGINNAWSLDDIQFSVSPVPEPGTLTLFVVCGLFLCLRIKPTAARNSN
jgi:hypothetical protein